MTGLQTPTLPFSPSADVLNTVLARVEDERVSLVDLQFSDVAGGMKSLTIPAALLSRTLHDGYRFDGAAMSGAARTVEVDLYLKPDAETLMILPQIDGDPKRAQIFCWVVRRGGQPFAGDPRATLQHQLEKASALGLDYRVGIELEFYLLDQSAPNGLNWLPAFDNLGYFDAGEDALSRTRHDILETLQALGIGVGGAHHETGPGQQEIDIQPAGGILIADQLITIRQTIRAIAQRHGLRATFMAKPFADAPGSGMHLFQRLLNLTNGQDLLHEPGSNHNLSATARHFIGGQLANARGMSAIVNTTVNSYKRLADGHRAPRHATWARVSQGSLIRVPADISGAATEIELRSPDAMANPYLAITAALGAAIDGIRNAEEPIAPLDENLIKFDDEELNRLGIPKLPATLGEALDAFATSDEMRNTLGDYVHDQLLSVKQAEWAEYRRHVSPWEHIHYGDL
ncbi:MAG: glutamine synthetase family protein [Thermomicrobiales bacterium]